MATARKAGAADRRRGIQCNLPGAGKLPRENPKQQERNDGDDQRGKKGQSLVGL